MKNTLLALALALTWLFGPRAVAAPPPTSGSLNFTGPGPHALTPKTTVSDPAGKFSTLTVASNATVSGNATVGGNLTVGGSITGTGIAWQTNVVNSTNVFDSYRAGFITVYFTNGVYAHNVNFSSPIDAAAAGGFSVVTSWTTWPWQTTNTANVFVGPYAGSNQWTNGFGLSIYGPATSSPGQLYYIALPYK